MIIVVANDLSVLGVFDVFVGYTSKQVLMDFLGIIFSDAKLETIQNY